MSQQSSTIPNQVTTRLVQIFSDRQPSNGWTAGNVVRIPLPDSLGVVNIRDSKIVHHGTLTAVENASVSGFDYPAVHLFTPGEDNTYQYPAEALIQRSRLSFDQLGYIDENTNQNIYRSNLFGWTTNYEEKNSLSVYGMTANVVPGANQATLGTIYDSDSLPATQMSIQATDDVDIIVPMGRANTLANVLSRAPLSGPVSLGNAIYEYTLADVSDATVVESTVFPQNENQEFPYTFSAMNTSAVLVSDSILSDFGYEFGVPVGTEIRLTGTNVSGATAYEPLIVTVSGATWAESLMTLTLREPLVQESSDASITNLALYTDASDKIYFNTWYNNAVDAEIELDTLSVLTNDTPPVKMWTGQILRLQGELGPEDLSGSTAIDQYIQINTITPYTGDNQEAAENCINITFNPSITVPDQYAVAKLYATYVPADSVGYTIDEIYAQVQQLTGISPAQLEKMSNVAIPFETLVNTGEQIVGMTNPVITLNVPTNCSDVVFLLNGDDLVETTDDNPLYSYQLQLDGQQLTNIPVVFGDNEVDSSNQFEQRPGQLYYDRAFAAIEELGEAVHAVPYILRREDGGYYLAPWIGTHIYRDGRPHILKCALQAKSGDTFASQTVNIFQKHAKVLLMRNGQRPVVIDSDVTEDPLA